MSGLEVIGVVISAVPIVTGFVKHFGTPRNAPRQVDRLSRMLEELRDERLLLAAMPAEQRHIHDMINRCTDVLEKETGELGTNQPNKIANRAFKFFWPAEAEKRLKEHNDELDRELDRLQRRVDRYRSSVAEGSLSPSAYPPSVSPPSYSPPDIRVPGADRDATGTANAPATLSPTLSPTVVSRRSIPMSPPASPRLSSRQPSVAAVELPVTLILQNSRGDPIGEKLKLHTLTIIERDDVWRRIEYAGRTSNGGLVRITHRIPRGSIWFEDEDLDDNSVSFLQPHDITIENAAGFTVYRSFSLYRFSSVTDREAFLVNVRERQLLGRFLVDKISTRGELVAQQKVVRLWKKVTTAVGVREVIKTTVAFIGRDGKPYEKGLGEFRRSASLLKDNRVELVEVASGTKLTLEFRRAGKGPAEKEKRGLFGGRRGSTASSLREASSGKTSDAALFRKIFEDNHPSTAGFSPLVLGSVGNPFNPYLGSVTGESHAESALPALSPSTSRAPTLSSISIPSGSFYSAVEGVSPKSSVVEGG